MNDDRLRATGARRRERQAMDGLAGARHQGRLHTQVPVEVADDACPTANELLNPSIRALLMDVLNSACTDCTLRAQCLRKPERSKVRQVAVLTRKEKAKHTQAMRTPIDSDVGRQQYGRRFATVEPVFGNVRHNKRLNRFTLRGRQKVDGQWKLYALVHNIDKWANFRKTA